VFGEKLNAKSGAKVPSHKRGVVSGREELALSVVETKIGRVAVSANDLERALYCLDRTCDRQVVVNRHSCGDTRHIRHGFIHALHRESERERSERVALCHALR